mmetsp:Transcript_4000/g.12000  ORF Transcript_4000/g.12000 Transcript_4000/m.12000 type:complete len:255 (+) Transcript_4000:556-1320(+)
MRSTRMVADSTSRTRNSGRTTSRRTPHSGLTENLRRRRSPTKGAPFVRVVKTPWRGMAIQFSTLSTALARPDKVAVDFSETVPTSTTRSASRSTACFAFASGTTTSSTSALMPYISRRSSTPAPMATTPTTFSESTEGWVISTILRRSWRSCMRGESALCWMGSSTTQAGAISPSQTSSRGAPTGETRPTRIGTSSRTGGRHTETSSTTSRGRATKSFQSSTSQTGTCVIISLTLRGSGSNLALMDGAWTAHLT